MQTARGACGWPEGTSAQVPLLVARSQASHKPVQAVLQQKPSTHLPLVHCAAAVQVLPLTLVPHEVPTHGAGVTQSAAVEQTSRQAVSSARQVNGAQVNAAGATQVPRPSQLLLPLTELVVGSQWPGAQVTADQRRHLPAPSQVPSR